MLESDIVGFARECVKILEEKKSENVLLLDLRKVNSYLDYFVISTGNSLIHCRSLAKEVKKLFAKNGLKERNKSSLDSGWIILDYSEIIVHIFIQEMRDYYSLERLWGDAEFLSH